MRELERYVILQVVDTRWREHLENMDYLREGVHLRAMAQKDPLVEYTSEGHAMFEELKPQSARRSCSRSSTPSSRPRTQSARARRTAMERRRARVRAPVAGRRGRDRRGGWAGGERAVVSTAVR